MQRPETSRGIMLDAGPHHQVVSAKFKHRLVGSPEFVDRLLPRVEKDAAGDGSRTEPGKHDHSASLSKDVLLQVLKELERLRRQAVFAARLALQ